MKRGMLLLVVILACAVLTSAIGVVYTKYLSRKTFAALQAIDTECDRAKTRWMRLQLEQSTLGGYPRVESIARAQLNLHTPVGEIYILR